MSLVVHLRYDRPQCPPRYREGAAMPTSFTGAHVPKDMTCIAIGWDVADLVRTQNLGDMRFERHLRCDHSTMNCWVITYSPQLEATCSRRTRPVWSHWRLVATDQPGKGPWVISTAPSRRWKTRLIFCPPQRMLGGQRSVFHPSDAAPSHAGKDQDRFDELCHRK